MENIKINEKIEQVISKCSDLMLYSNILKELFTNGIEKPSNTLMSLNILPILKEKDIKNNIKKNISNIISYIQNDVKSCSDAYQVLSCIFGAFLGDALGAFCEFHKISNNNYKKIFKSTPVFGGVKGQVTDDSEMAMSLAYAIMDNPYLDNIDVNYLYFYYGAWSKSNPIDIGNTTKKSFMIFDFYKFLPEQNNFDKVSQIINNSNRNSLSNGFLMRKSTFIVWLYYRFYNDINKAFSQNDNNEKLLKLYDKIKELSHIDNQCTHQNEETDVASAFYCIMALGAIRGDKACNIIDKLVSLCKDKYFQNNKNEDYNIVMNILFFVQTFSSKDFDFWKFFGNKSNIDFINKHIGYYEHAFKLTLYYLIHFDKIEQNNKFRIIFNQICNLGGDTDTNACIVGAVIGPLIGYSNFGEDFDKIITIIPPNRSIYSISLMYIYIKYLKNSNRNKELINNKRYFLKTILDLIYNVVEIDYA